MIYRTENQGLWRLDIIDKGYGRVAIYLILFEPNNNLVLAVEPKTCVDHQINLPRKWYT